MLPQVARVIRHNNSSVCDFKYLFISGLRTFWFPFYTLKRVKQNNAFVRDPCAWPWHGMIWRGVAIVARGNNIMFIYLCDGCAWNRFYKKKINIAEIIISIISSVFFFCLICNVAKWQLLHHSVRLCETEGYIKLIFTRDFVLRFPDHLINLFEIKCSFLDKLSITCQ